jgi:hypothetical protein
MHSRQRRRCGRPGEESRYRPSDPDPAVEYRARAVTDIWSTGQRQELAKSSKVVPFRHCGPIPSSALEICVPAKVHTLPHGFASIAPLGGDSADAIAETIAAIAGHLGRRSENESRYAPEEMAMDLKSK